MANPWDDDPVVGELPAAPQQRQPAKRQPSQSQIPGPNQPFPGTPASMFAPASPSTPMQAPKMASMFAPPPSTPAAQPWDNDPVVGQLSTSAGVPSSINLPSSASFPGFSSRVDPQAYEKDKDINYKDGAAWSTRIAVERAQNPKEAELALKKYYGSGNYGQDRNGNWWVKEDGKRVSVFPGGGLGAMAQNVGAAVVGQRGAALGSMIGMGLGAAAGEALFPFGGGVPGSIIGAPIGAAIGKGIDDLSKWTQGLFDETPEEVARSMTAEATMTGATSLIGPAARVAARPIKWFVQKKIAHVTPEGGRMARDIEAGLPTGEKGVPRIGTYAPGATSMEYHRQLRDILAGPTTTAATRKNIIYLEARLRNALDNEGFSPQEINDIVEEAKAGTAVSSQEAGRAVSEKGTELHSELVNNFTAAKGEAERELVAKEKALREWTAAAPPQLGADVVTPIVEYRQAWGKQMADVYKTVSNLNGNKKSVNTIGIRAAAKELADITPPSQLPPIIKEFVGKDARKWMTFQQAHALRTSLREMAHVEGLQPAGISIGRVKKMAAATDHAISNIQGKMGEKAAAALKVADNLYAKGAAIWYNAEINHLIGQMRSGIIPEPGKVASVFMKHDNVELAKAVLNMLPAEVKEQVVKADLGNMIDSASHLAKDGRFRVDGKSFYENVMLRKKLIQATYPPDAARDIEKYAMDVAAFDGQVDVTMIQNNPSQIVAKLKEAATHLQAADIFAREDPVGALRGGNPAQVDRAMSVITAKGKEATTEAAAKTLGIDSREWWQVRKYALQQVFSKMFETLPSMEKRISGPAIHKALEGYTPRQLELLFPGELYKDIEVLAKEAHFLFPLLTGDFGQSLAAAAIKQHMPIKALPRYLWAQLWGWVADHPRVLKYLTSEIKTDPVRARGIMGLIGQTVMNQNLLAGPGQERPPGRDVPRTVRPQQRPDQTGLGLPVPPMYGGIGEQ